MYEGDEDSITGCRFHHVVGVTYMRFGYIFMRRQWEGRRKRMWGFWRVDIFLTWISARVVPESK